jgi:hypothetical protein
MSHQDRTTSTLERAQTVLTYLLRDPVKEAVREALRERATIPTPDGSHEIRVHTLG